MGTLRIRNKHYSPDTCVFVPKTINSLFPKSDINRGNLPIGVNMVGSKYQAHISCNNKSYHIGMFNTIDEAFIAYKNAKEKHIREVADIYKDKIPQKLYDVMYNYRVEITD